MRGAVLAGGAASRYGGQPKGLLQVGGRRILDRVVDAVAAATGTPPLLVANAPDAQSWRPDLRTIPDARPGAGSLGGIYTAVAAFPEPVLCVAWDMPFVPAALLVELIGGSVAYDAFLPESDPKGLPAGRGRRGVEPLCAVYGPACRDAITAQLDAGDLRAIGFHPRVNVGTLSLDRVRAFGDPDQLFFNVNRPEDLARAEDVWRRRG
ncbi:MAG TPA: molybdenum cofactor guanylyltransferase [Gemmatimonadales bacterium]|nr:molybdenum cofactor guanylyltransferase [Gemmatimonadales bacterium]